MRVLCTGFWLVAARLSIICRAVAAANYLACSGQRLLGDTQGIGTHVSDQADRALTGDLYALVKLLRDHHCAAWGHVEFARRLLLERRGDEGRRGSAFFLRLFHAGHRKWMPFQCVQNRLHILLTGQFTLLRVAIIVCSKAARLTDPVQIHVQRPVFLRDKGPDLVFTVYDQTGCNRLHTAGRQALADLFPE